MRQLDAFKPFDTQVLRETDHYELLEMKRIINVLVEEVKALRNEIK